MEQNILYLNTFSDYFNGINDIHDCLIKINERVKNGLFHLSDNQINCIYELYTNGLINLTENDVDFMFLIINQISNKLYGDKNND